MAQPLTLQEAKNSIGKKFYIKLPTEEGRPVRIALKQYDVVEAFVESTGKVFGDYSAAHYTDCYFLAEQPEQLKKHETSICTIPIS